MKTNFLMALLLLSPISKAEVNFYKDNSAISLSYALRVYDLDNDPKRKLIIARRLSKTMFSYWYNTNFSNLEKSERMDSMLAHVYSVYKDGTMKGEGLQSVFEDPLNWMDKKRNQFVLNGGIIKNKKHYEKLLPEYFAFLENNRNTQP